ACARGGSGVRPRAALGGVRVASLTDLAAGTGTVPRADVLIFRLAGGQVVLRPSGTEPKIKCYIEIIGPAAGRSLAAAREAAAARLAPLRAALGAVLSFPPVLHQNETDDPAPGMVARRTTTLSTA